MCDSIATQVEIENYSGEMCKQEHTQEVLAVGTGCSTTAHYTVRHSSDWKGNGEKYTNTFQISVYTGILVCC